MSFLAVVFVTVCRILSFYHIHHPNDQASSLMPVINKKAERKQVKCNEFDMESGNFYGDE